MFLCVPFFLPPPALRRALPRPLCPPVPVRIMPVLISDAPAAAALLAAELAPDPPDVDADERDFCASSLAHGDGP